MWDVRRALGHEEEFQAMYNSIAHHCALVNQIDNTAAAAAEAAAQLTATGASFWLRGDFTNVIPLLVPRQGRWWLFGPMRADVLAGSGHTLPLASC
jgi:hypothetical protein